MPRKILLYNQLLIVLREKETGKPRWSQELLGPSFHKELMNALFLGIESEHSGSTLRRSEIVPIKIREMAQQRPNRPNGERNRVQLLRLDLIIWPLMTDIQYLVCVLRTKDFLTWLSSLLTYLPAHLPIFPSGPRHDPFLLQTWSSLL